MNDCVAHLNGTRVNFINLLHHTFEKIPNFEILET